MRCPVCNTPMNNGVCPDCGMKVRTGPAKQVEYDPHLKRTGTYANKSALEKNFDMDTFSSNPMKKINLPKEKPTFKVNPPPTYKKKQTSKKSNRAVSIVVFIVILVFALAGPIKSIVSKIVDYGNMLITEDYSGDDYNAYSEDDYSVDDWDYYIDGEHVTYNGKVYTFNEDLGILVIPEDNSNFVYRGQYYYVLDDYFYYNPDLDITFNSKFEKVSNDTKTYKKINLYGKSEITKNNTSTSKVE